MLVIENLVTLSRRAYHPVRIELSPGLSPLFQWLSYLLEKQAEEIISQNQDYAIEERHNGTSYGKYSSFGGKVSFEPNCKSLNQRLLDYFKALLLDNHLDTLFTRWPHFAFSIL